MIPFNPQILDISVHNGKIDAAKMASRGVHTVWVRSSIRLTGYDANYATNQQALRRENIQVNLYHLWDSRWDWFGQLENIKKQSSICPVGDQHHMEIAIDVEEAFRRTRPQVDNMYKLLDSIQEHYGRSPWIYTSIGFWNNWANSGPVYWAREFPLWVSDVNSREFPLIPSDWKMWHLWQCSGDGNGLGSWFGVESGSVDLNKANPTLERD